MLEELLEAGVDKAAYDLLRFQLWMETNSVATL